MWTDGKEERKKKYSTQPDPIPSRHRAFFKPLSSEIRSRRTLSVKNSAHTDHHGICAAAQRPWKLRKEGDELVSFSIEEPTLNNSRHVIDQRLSQTFVRVGQCRQDVTARTFASWLHSVGFPYLLGITTVLGRWVGIGWMESPCRAKLFWTLSGWKVLHHLKHKLELICISLWRSILHWKRPKKDD